MAEPRVVISGIGVVSPFGVGRERFWECVSRGCSGVRALQDDEFSESACRVAAPVTGVSIADVPALEGEGGRDVVGSSRVDLQACKLEYSIVSPK